MGLRVDRYRRVRREVLQGIDWGEGVEEYPRHWENYVEKDEEEAVEYWEAEPGMVRHLK